MIRRICLCGAVLCLLLVLARPANATATASATATIDWGSVTITAVGNTQIFYSSFSADAQTAANLNTVNQVILAQHYNTDLNTNISQTYSVLSSNRTLNMSSAVDLVGQKTISASSSDSSNQAGSFGDISQAQQWIYLYVEGDDTINVQGNYSLTATASASQFGEFSAAQADAVLWLYDEATNTWAIKDEPGLAAFSSIAVTSSQPTTGQFNDTATIPTDTVYRLQFYTDAFTVVNSPAPTPEPASVLLVGVGLLAMARRKKNI